MVISIPHFFTYPTFHYYLLALVYLTYFAWQNTFAAGYSFEQFLAFHYLWDRLELMGVVRLLSALYGAGTVVWVALLARRVSGRRGDRACVGLYIRLAPEGENAVELKRWLQGKNIHP